METILTNALIQKYKQLSGRCRAVFFSAPTGFGKTVAARALATGKRVVTLSARDPAFALPPAAGTWATLVVDDLQDLNSEADQQALCDLLRDCPDRRFLFLSRGPLPSCLMPFQAAGVLGLLTARDLLLDRGAAARLLQSHGITLAQAELAAVCQETQGYPLALELLALRLERGEPCTRTTLDNTRLDLYRYYEETVLRRLDAPTRTLLTQMAPFAPVTLDLARLVTGDNHAGERMAALLRTTSMLQQDKLGSYRFWPLFRDFLLWELDQHTSDSQRRTLYARAGLHYELAEDYGRALDCYAHSGNTDKISELLEKNAEMHPGMGHYLEMEPYYRALPEEEVLQSPALMQGMSMLCAMRMDFAASERWYTALRDFAAHNVGDKAREAKGRLAWLDIGLPQRPVEATAELFPKVFALISARQIRLPPFSVTSTLPSLMNGGKDFSPWSKRDTLLYATLRTPVEAVLGRDGVGLADCALAESQFEKGKDIRDQAIKLLAMQDRIRRYGTPDMEFAVVGLPEPEVPDAEPDTGYRLEQSELTVVPAELRNQYNSVDEIQDAMYAVAVKALPDITAENTELHDVTLLFSKDGGLTWTKATKENFPASGITVTLPYPEGTNAADYDFVVTHMATVAMNGLGVGKVETPAVTKSEKGLRFTVRSLSPVAVSWSKIETGGSTPAPSTPAPSTSTSSSPDDSIYYTCPKCGYHNWTATDEGYRCDHCGNLVMDKQLAGYPNVKGTYTPATGSKPSTVTGVPQTGDESNMVLWLGLLIVSGLALGGLAIAKRKKQQK